MKIVAGAETTEGATTKKEGEVEAGTEATEKIGKIQTGENHKMILQAGNQFIFSLSLQNKNRTS